MSLEKERRKYLSIGNVIAGLMFLGALGGVWGTLAADSATNKQRLSTLEQRNDETRKEIKDVAHEIKVDVKEVKNDVQQILRKLDSMDAVQRSERTRDRRPQ